MCGIFCEIFKEIHSNLCIKNLPDVDTEILEKCKENLRRRGPDTEELQIVDNINFYATVLHQQGLIPYPQPVIEENFVLLYNGDLFMNLNLKGQSDTCYLHNRLCNIKDELELIELFSSLNGPYSIIYYNRNWKKLYFLRDPLGRNSLLIGLVDNSFIITSVGNFQIVEQIAEVPPIGVYCFSVKDFELQLFPWYDIDSHVFYKEQLQILNDKIGLNLHIDETKTIALPWMIPLHSEQFSLKNVSIQSELETPNEVVIVCDKLISLLEESVKERVLATTDYCKMCKPNSYCKHCRVGILFSGGLDCSILAVLADKYISYDEPIDLFNVAFEKVDRSKTKKDKIIDWNVPDRITAKQTLIELENLCPNRVWNLVEVNVTRKELEYQLLHHLKDLISPLRNILDESLGAALWFAARGKGVVNEIPYVSNCRVLLIGSGADELFAGYTRHRNAFKRNGIEALTDELELDWVRLPNRNLARDDRVIGDHSITPRTPYLQENFVQFIQSLSPNQRCNLELEQGVGDKLLLRMCANKLGLKECSLLKKRALQFGSRIADRKQKADQFSSYLHD